MPTGGMSALEWPPWVKPAHPGGRREYPILKASCIMKIFFDVDGVLIDGWHTKVERRKRWDTSLRQDFGIDPQELQQKFFQSPTGKFPSLMHACVSGECDLKEALSAILPSVGYERSIDAFVAYWFEKDSNINRDVFDSVKSLAGHADVNLYLATGQEHYRAAYLWNDLGFNEQFKDIFYSAKVGHLKNTPEFFQRINSLLGIVAGERPLYFDDDEEVVRLACKAGWDACLFETIGDLRNHPRLQGLLRG